MAAGTDFEMILGDSEIDRERIYGRLIVSSYAAGLVQMEQDRLLVCG